MLFGAHVSIAGGIQNSPKRSLDLGGEVFQIFSRSPRGGKAPEITSDIISEFNLNLKKYKQREFYIHTPYYINLGSSNNRIYYGSISVLGEELERGSKLGAKYLMTHLGSAKDLGEKKSFEKVVKGIKEVLKKHKGKTKFLIETGYWLAILMVMEPPKEWPIMVGLTPRCFINSLMILAYSERSRGCLILESPKPGRSRA